MDDFASRLLRWFHLHGRHDLPWQHPRLPYRVWLSEVMLQQTQVRTVLPYFSRFVDKLPNIQSLAAASEDDVLALWSGLGYYSRARNLHRAAKICVDQHDAALPNNFDALLALPGIGRSTAGAILAQAFEQPIAILDANVKRVLARWHGIAGSTTATNVQRELWFHAETHTPQSYVADYTQAIMDLGAAVCIRRRPRCEACPVSSGCVALRDGLTTTLPTVKPARQVPQRSTVMMILRDAQGRLLIERRGPAGVWAGLWSLPEAADENAARTQIARTHAIATSDVEFRALPAFIHGFTHFRLAVTPLESQLRDTARIADDANQRWLYPAQATELGLPAPVRKLIAQL